MNLENIKWNFKANEFPKNYHIYKMKNPIILKHFDEILKSCYSNVTRGNWLWGMEINTVGESFVAVAIENPQDALWFYVYVKSGQMMS